MIPKEAFEKLQEILLVTFNLDGFDEELDMIRKALERVKKVEELLGLYKDLALYGKTYTLSFYEWNQVEQLEKELEEMK